MDELVVDGEKYISSGRAARLSGYAKDYIGQLCRAGKVDAKMVGRSWYVKESAIKEHRKTFRGQAVIDDKLWAEGKNGLEFRGFGSAIEPPKSRLNEEHVKIHYESDPRPLIPAVEQKGSKEELSSTNPLDLLPPIDKMLDTESSPVRPIISRHFAGREQIEEEFPVAEKWTLENQSNISPSHFSGTPALKKVASDETSEAISRTHVAILRKRHVWRTNTRFILLLMGAAIGIFAFVLLLEAHYVYNKTGEGFEHISSSISVRNIIADARLFLLR